MKAITTAVIIILLSFSFSSYSQKIFMYGEKGIKVYFQKADSIVQIKFKKNTDIKEKINITKLVNPDNEISIISNNNRVFIPINKNKQPNYDDLKKNNSTVYANQSLLSDDGTIQIPTDKVLVKIKNSYELGEILKRLGIDYESYKRLGHDENSYMIIIKDGESLNTANTLYESGYFEYAQPSFTRFIKMMNEFYPSQWGLNNTGQNGGTAGIDINAPEAWTMTRGCNNIRVAVIDQGVDLNHPDLEGNLLPGFDATDGANGGANGDCWGNDAHGTCCAGIIGAINNTIGIIGVAHGCQIIPIRIFYTTIINSQTITVWDDDWAVDAINHAWEASDADVLSCSWGGGTAVQAVNTEIADALSQGRNNLGCVVVFSTGNNNSSVAWSANSNEDIISVGAMSPCGQRKRSSSNISELNPGVTPDTQGVSCDNEKWWGSNYGNELDLIAPGVFVPTTDIQGTAGYNTSAGVAGNYYQSFNGTSSATPHVAGVAALILSINPGLTQDQVRDVIELTCTKVGSYNYSTASGRNNGTWCNEVGYGCVNAFAAVQRAAGGPITGSSVLCTGTSYSLPFLNGLTVTWNTSPNISRVSPQGSNPCTFSTNGSGIGSVSATINSGCGEVALPQKPVWVGAPSTPTSISGFCCNGKEFGSESIYEFTVVPEANQGADQYAWVVSGGTILEGQGTHTITVETWTVTGSKNVYFDVNVNVGNNCGWSPLLSRTGYVTSGSGPLTFYVVYPNPTSSEVAITIKSDNSIALSDKKNKSIKYLRVVDKFGSTLYSQKYGTNTFETKINVSDFPTGIYIIKINEGIDEESHSLVKQ